MSGEEKKKRGEIVEKKTRTNNLTGITSAGVSTNASTASLKVMACCSLWRARASNEGSGGGGEGGEDDGLLVDVDVDDDAAATTIDGALREKTSSAFAAVPARLLVAFRIELFLRGQKLFRESNSMAHSFVSTEKRRNRSKEENQCIERGTGKGKKKCALFYSLAHCHRFFFRPRLFFFFEKERIRRDKKKHRPGERFPPFLFVYFSCCC